MSVESPHLKEIEHDQIEDINPNSLMDNIAQSTLTKTIIISLIIHLFLIGATSVKFIYQCKKYKTLEPQKVIQQLEAKARKKKQEEEKQLRLKKAQEAEKKRIEAARKKEAEAKKKASEKKVSKTEKEVNEVSKERPQTGGLDSLDDELE